MHHREKFFDHAHHHDAERDRIDAELFDRWQRNGEPQQHLTMPSISMPRTRESMRMPTKTMIGDTSR
jgi:hypothetical protein